MGSEAKYTNIDTLRQTRLYSLDAQLFVADGMNMVKERFSTLTWRLPNDLASKICDDCTKEVTKNCRVICDFKIVPGEDISERKCYG